MPISALSRITHVSVHARGAVVTRTVDVPELPPGEVDLVVAGLTPLSDAGSVRAEVRGQREVISLQASLQVPSETARAGASVEKLQALEWKKQRLDAELQQIGSQRQTLQALSPVPRLRLGGRFEPADERITEALAASSLLKELAASLDARGQELTRRLRELQHELDAAALEDAQRSAAERMGTGHPTRQITLRLGDGGAVESLQLSYQVPAARWWPVYTLRLGDGGRTASWWLEALVAQRSGEDWRDVKLSLATADLIHDARLPELPSLRLGRKQAAPKKAYRPPPEGLDQMFVGYDRAFSQTAPEMQTRGPEGFAPPEPKMAPGAPPPPPPRAAPAMQMAPMPMPQMAVAAMPKKGGVLGGLFSGGGGATMARSMSADMARQEESFDEAPPEPEPTAIEPQSGWLEFDRLVMAGPTGAGRGRLRQTPPNRREDGQLSAQLLEALAPPKVRDPRETRGLFDHRYDAAGKGDVPSDGVPQRVTVGVAEAPCQLAYRAIPREAPDVYKEARLQNPFKSPLLAGPVDVYVEGSLLLVSEIDRIDVGGEMTVGLGVEDRIRVARNARVDEGSAGLLGGSVVVDSEVTIDLTSSLGREVRVEVADRIPVSDEDDLAITVVSSKPAHAEYDQKERGAPIRQGLRWTLALPASGKGQIVFRYKLTFPSKNEISGGNRRE